MATLSNGTYLTPLEVWHASNYHYIPTQWVCAIFVTLYSISALLHIAQAIKYKMWWLFPTAVFAGVAETLGWSARLWSSINFLLDTPFMIQICVTILAPTPLVAANFIILGRIVTTLGTRYSRLSPKLYTRIFCGFDIMSLMIQSVGGGVAAQADTDSGTALGAHIMLAGIASQMVFITIYVVFASEFLYRFFKDLPVRVNAATEKIDGPRVIINKELKTMIFALCMNTFFLYVRAIYRLLELSNGWDGTIIATQNYFNIFDGAMVVLAIYTLNFFHPGRLLDAPLQYVSGKTAAQHTAEIYRKYSGGSSQFTV